MPRKFASVPQFVYLYVRKQTEDMEFLYSLINMLAEMSPYLLLGFGIAGLLYAFVPGDFYRNHLSRPGVLSVIKAALIPLPRPFVR